MAKKKTKLNNSLAAALLVSLLVVGGGGAVAFVYYRTTYRPQQHKTEGRELMLKGDYEEAEKRFSRAGHRLGTDMEFLGWMLETRMRLTSFRDQGYRDAMGLVDAMLGTNPNHVPTLIERLKHLVFLCESELSDQAVPTLPVDRVPAEEMERMGIQAEKVLKEQPDNPVAIEALALSKAAPALRDSVTQGSGVAEAALAELRTMLEASPNNPDLVLLFARVQSRYVKRLAADMQIKDEADDPKVTEMREELTRRLDDLLAAAADESKPAEWRGRAYLAAADSETFVFALSPKRVDDFRRVLARRNASFEAAGKLLPPTDPQYMRARSAYVEALMEPASEKPVEAEQVLRQTVEAVPAQWYPRLALAEFLSDRGRPDEAIEALSADLKPSYDLVGRDGLNFRQHQKIVALRRAYFRLQKIGGLPAPQRDPADIARIQADYDAAVADGRNPETDPHMLQIRAGLLELSNDRTGAIQLLTRAVQAMGTGRGYNKSKVQMMSQIVSLNLGLRQLGAAIAMQQQVVAAESTRYSSAALLRALLFLAELHLQAGETTSAQALLDQANQRWPNHPLVQTLMFRAKNPSIDPVELLGNIKEDSIELRRIKFNLAIELKVDAEVKRLGDAILAENPGMTDMVLRYVTYLRQSDQREAALKLLRALQEKRPDDRNLALLIQDTEAVTKEDREKLIQNLFGPGQEYQAKLFEAEQARQKADIAAYIARLEEAEKLDTKNDGAATERLTLINMASGKFAEAEQGIDRLSKAGRDPSDIRVLRIRLALSQGKVTEAGSLADALVAERPGFAPGWVVKGQTHQTRGQFDQAITAYETAVAVQPNNIEALRGLVESSQRVGRQALFKKYLDIGQRVSNGDEYFSEWALRYEIAYGDPVATIEPRLKRRDAHPDDPAAWAALAQSYDAAANARTKAADEKGAKEYRDKLVATLRDAMAKFPEMPAFAIDTAGQLFRQGDAEGAWQLVEGLRTDPKFAGNAAVQSGIVDFYLGRGQLERAVQTLQQAIQATQDNEPLKIKLARIYQGVGGKENAEAALALTTGLQDSAAVRELKMELLLALQRPDEAEKLVNDALTAERSGANLLMAAFVKAARGQTDEAVRLAASAVEMTPEDPIGRFTRARILLGKRPIPSNEIIADLAVVRRNAPDNVEARLILVDRLQAVGRGSEALQELEALNREYPGNIEGAVRLIQTYASERPARYGRIDQVLVDAKKSGLDRNPRLLMLEAGVFSTRNGPGDMQRAIEVARTAAMVNPGDIQTFRFFLGVLIKAGANKEVIAEINRIEAANATFYWTYLVRGVAHHRLRQEAEAGKDFDRAMQIAQSLKEGSGAIQEIVSNYAIEYGGEAAVAWASARLPDTVESKVIYMRVLQAAGKLEKAVQLGEAMLPELDKLPVPARLQILNTLGAAYLTATPQLAGKAREIFEQIDKLQPDNMLTLNNLAYAMALPDSGASMEQAAKVAKRAYELSMQNAEPNPYIIDTYGWTLVQSGDVDAGKEVLRKALEIQRLPETEYHLGYVALLTRDKNDALRYLQNALENLNRAEQNGQDVEKSLRDRIEQSLREANALPDPSPNP